MALAVIAATMINASAFAQNKRKPPPKPFVEPPVRLDWGMFKGGLVMRDEGCARDFVRAQFLEGVERQKLLVEIVVLGCAEKVPTDRPTKAWERVEISAAGHSVIFRHVAIFGMIQKFGWVPESDLRIEPAEYCTDMGKVCHLANGTTRTKAVPVATSLEAYNEYQKAIAASDTEGLQQMVMAGKILMASDGDGLRLLDQGRLNGWTEGTLTSGQYAGRHVWATMLWVK